MISRTPLIGRTAGAVRCCSTTTTTTTTMTMMPCGAAAHQRMRRGTTTACQAQKRPALPSKRSLASELVEDILAPSSSEPRALSYKIEKGGQVQSSHPDALKRRQRAERRKERRRLIYDAGVQWWQVVRECSPNIVVAECSDEFYHSLRLARAARRDVIVMYFSPKCSACKEEAVHCAQIASENPDKDFIRVHHDKCKGVSDSHDITKLPWVQYYKHGSSKPIKEDLRLTSFDTLLQIPKGLEASSQTYCVASDAVIEEIKSFHTLLEAINL
mmetsp:Transcript_4361/g.12828  ORF Transcript_4361/g.12828 Transcript_4361/m.12828 type:complete len:272 (-) Transcript_4361:127-942(-)